MYKIRKFVKLFKFVGTYLKYSNFWFTAENRDFKNDMSCISSIITTVITCSVTLDIN